MSGRLAQYGLAARFVAKPHLHVGFIGTVPSSTDGLPVSSFAPGRTGGNIDNRHLGQTTRIFLPVEVKGAQLFLGEASETPKTETPKTVTPKTETPKNPKN